MNSTHPRPDSSARLGGRRRDSFFYSLAAVMLWAVAGACLAAPGDIDVGFGSGGRVTAGGPVIPLPDGRIVLGRRIGGGFEVVAYDAAGRPASSGFGDAGRTFVSLPSNGYFGGPAVRMPDGRLLFAGGLSTQSGQDHKLLRLDANGLPDRTIGTRGDGTVDLPGMRDIVGLAGLSDGRMLILDWQSECVEDGCYGPLVLWRLRADGAVDTAFGVNGKVEIPGSENWGDWSPIFSVRPNGSIVVGGNATPSGLLVLTASGQVDTTFDTGTGGGRNGVVLPDGGVLLVGIASNGSAWGTNETRVWRLRPDGRADTGFGGGSGFVTINLSALVSTRTDIDETEPQIALAPDGSSVYLQTTVEGATIDSDFYCLAVARLSLAGVLDTAFGSRGVSCITRSNNFQAADGLAVQATGEPLLTLAGVNLVDRVAASVYRLRIDNGPSPGVIGLHSYFSAVDEGVGTVTIRVSRSAGKSGAVSVSYATESTGATSGDDYVPVSGRLDWADGDNTERTISITIRNDSTREDSDERFLLKLSSPTGGALLLGSAHELAIMDNDASTPPPTTPPTPPPASSGGSSGGGGGGAVEVPGLLALAGLAGWRRRRLTVVVGRVGLLFALAASTCFAAPGDIDTGFGTGGRLDAGVPVMPLPDGRIVVGRRINGGFEVTAYDAAGRTRDPAFGSAGTTFVALPANGYFGGPAVRTANGRLLFTGELPKGGTNFVRGLLRLDSNGRVDTTFGTRGDGVVELAGVVQIVGLIGLADGRTLVLDWQGEFLGDGSMGPLILWRLLPNGAVDTTFGESGKLKVPGSDNSSGGWPPIFAARPDGSIIVGDGDTGLLVVLTSNGAVDSTFDASAAGGWRQGVMLPDGGLILAGSVGAWSTQDIRLWKLRADGRADTTFGGGSGTVTLNLSAVVSSRSDLTERLGDVALSPNGQYAYLQLQVDTGEFGSDFNCLGVARVTMAGALDTGFGQRGVSCVTRTETYVPVDHMMVQATGEPLVVLGSQFTNLESVSPAVRRLRIDGAPSAGVIGVQSGTWVSENVGTVSVKVYRSAGKNGAVSVNWSTQASTATAGEDFVAASGRLDWADGDDTERTITVTIRDDSIAEPSEILYVGLESPTGSAVPIGSRASIGIEENDTSSTPPSGGGSSGGGGGGGSGGAGASGGGGGAVGLPALLALAGLVAYRRRRDARRTAAARSLS